MTSPSLPPALPSFWVTAGARTCDAQLGLFAPTRGQCEGAAVSGGYRFDVLLGASELRNASGCFAQTFADEVQYVYGTATSSDAPGCPVDTECFCVTARPPAAPPLPPFVPLPSSPPCFPVADVARPPPPAVPATDAPTPPFVPIPLATCDGSVPSPRCTVVLTQQPCLHPDYLAYDCIVISRSFFHAFLPVTCIDQDHKDVTPDCFELGTVSDFLDVKVFFGGVVLRTLTHFDPTLLHTNAPSLDRLVHVLPVRFGTTLRFYRSITPLSF